MDLSEFDYEQVVHSFTVQDAALEQSHMQKFQHDKTYEETLREYREKNKEFLELKQHIQFFSCQLYEKLSVTSCLSDLQLLPNSKINTNADETLHLYERMEKDVGEFINKVNTLVVEITGVETEFDDAIIESLKRECIKHTENLVNDIITKRESYDLKENGKKEFEYKTESFNLKKTLNQLWENLDVNEIKAEIFQSEQQDFLNKKNIGFLKQENRELLVQLEN